MSMQEQAKTLKTGALRFLDSVRVKGEPFACRMSPSSDPVLIASLMYIHVRELYNDIRNMTAEERQGWIEFLNSMQDPDTGYLMGFEGEKQARDEKYDPVYMALMNSGFGFSAVRILRGEPRYELRFLNEWLKPGWMASYIKNRNWANPGHETDRLTLMAMCLGFEMDRRQSEAHRQAIHRMLDVCDEIQDSETGLWGSNIGSNAWGEMAAAWHLILIYNYMQRPVRFPEKIIDHTLKLQGDDGHFFPPEKRFGTCSDMDATDILVSLSRRIDYRRTDIERALWRLLEANSKLLNPDGGFKPSRLDSPLTTWKLSDDVRNPLPGESDMQATWFRSILIALSCQMLPNNPYACVDWHSERRLGTGWLGN